MIEKEEYALARKTLDFALEAGASDARVCLDKGIMDIVNILNAEPDRVTHCFDRAISLTLFVDGRFGSFSTNKMDEPSLKDFVSRSVEMTRNLAPDPFRKMPDPSRKERGAKSGLELEVYDPRYEKLTASQRLETARTLSVYPRKGDGWEIVSEEGEYCDNCSDNLILDSEGLECLHSETSFEYSVEITIQTKDGQRYTGFWWDAAPFLKDLSACGETALERACSQIGSKPSDSRRTNMVILNDCASKVVSPILKALNGYAIQQGSSFLKDSLLKRVFPEGLTIVEKAREKGGCGCRLFDSEGVSTSDSPIIEKGVVKQYFINTYMSGKLGMAPTSEGPQKPALSHWPENGPENCGEILRACGEGILVTDFNGGNFNGATGDFSYGIEGFLFKDGRISGPVSEMLVTGNILELWKNFLYAGNDPRPCMSKLIPTLAFANVDFSG